MPSLTTPVQVGAFNLKNRVVLAPLTRLRNSAEGVPPEFAAKYYSQRTTDGGLIITEATAIAAEAAGLKGLPGLWSSAQIAAWKKVTEAVHAKGGVIFSQLWALGRVANPALVKVFGPSDDTYTGGGEPVSVSQLSEADIDRFVGHYRQAALNAMEAGFDGVEIHGANGYLIDQFLQSVSNKRTDQYGGSLENRFRFPLRVVNAVAEAIGADRVGLRMSPFSEFQGMRETNPLAVFVPWTKAVLGAQKLAYIHAVEPRIAGAGDQACNEADTLEPIRDVVDAAGSAFIAAGGFTPQTAVEVVEKHGGLVAFGRLYIANPDLLDRIVQGYELNEYNRNTFYTPGEVGYTDYPTYDQRPVSSVAA